IDEAKLKAIRKKFEDLDPLMQVYKPREKKGLGVGPKAKGDGIELLIQNYAKPKPATVSAAVLEKRGPDFIKAANVNLTMHEITKLYPPKKPVCGKGIKEWNQYND